MTSYPQHRNFPNVCFPSSESSPDRKYIFVSQVSTVFAPFRVILVTLTSFRFISTGIIHPTCTFPAVDVRASPIIYS